MSESVWRPGDKGPQLQVVLLKYNGEPRDSYRASVESRSNELLVLRAIATKNLDFGNLTIDRGDQMRQFFPLKEWFYIQEYSDSKGRVKGWYCNIGTPPEMRESTIASRDLILDIFVGADHTILVR